MNITSFITWFINEFINLGATILGMLDNIELANDVTLLGFIITITILGAFLSIILTIPNTANRIESRYEKKTRSKAKER